MPQPLPLGDARVVRAVLAEDAPELALRAVRVLRSDVPIAVVAVDDDLVLRVAQDADAVVALERERRLLELLASRVTLAIPTPTVAGRRTAWYGYRRIAGVPLTPALYRSLPPHRKHAVCSAVARFLHEVHSALDARERETLGLDSPHEPPPAEELRRRLVPVLDVSGQLRFRPFLDGLLDRYGGIRIEERDRAVLHGDLHGYNMAVDPVTLHLAGIFDFGSIAFGDRHLDLRYLLAWEPQMLSLVVGHYTGLSGRALSMERSVLYSAANDLYDLVWRTEQGVEIVGGPIAARLARLETTLGSLGTLGGS